MTTTYNIAKAPVEAAKDLANLALWPVHIGTTVATNTVDTFFKVVGMNTEDVPAQQLDKETVLCENGSVYGMANDNLQIASVIYYYTELRSATRRLLKNFALKNNMSVECTNPTDPSHVMILRTAIKAVNDKSELIKSPEATASAKALKDFKDSAEQLDSLRKRYKLDQGDIEVFKMYFGILDEPKKLTNIKSDVIRYDKVIDPAFRLAFGGSEYNRQKISDMLECNTGGYGYIHHIDDDFTSTSMDPQGIVEGFDAEIVWAIFVSEKEQKITVVFRGSVSGSDWMSNIQCNMTDFKLPGFTSTNNKDEGKTYGRVHEGFYRYLFEETKAGANGSTKSKGEEIIGMLKGDFFDKAEYKDYSLYVTGHSLGASLSTMFAFRAAALNEFKMVMNVSFASPFVGNQAFRDAFYDLERKRKIQHLRISNYQDVVPLIPAMTFPAPQFDTYKHVGMNIRMYAGDDFLAPSYRRFYPKMGSFPDKLRNSMHANILLGLSVGIIGKHLCPEYTKRLQNEKMAKELKKLSLDELYGNKDITGWSYITDN